MRKLHLGFVLLYLLQIGASTPERSSVSPKASPSSEAPHSKQSFSAATSPQAVGDQIVKFLGGKAGRGKTGQELMSEKAGNMAVAGVASTQVFSGKPSASAKKPASVQPASVKSVPAIKSGYVPPPPTARASVPKIRQEIQKILDLNKKIKNVQSGSTTQFQRVQEQARIHQKILNELEATQEKSSAQKVPTKSALLAQEKLRIIHEDTQRNAQMMEGLSEAPVKTVPRETSKAKTAAS